MKKIFFILSLLIAFSVFAQEGKYKILMIIAKNGFRDEELFVPREILENNGYNVDIASSTQGLCRGMLGHRVNADISLKDVDLSSYECVIFVGGAGASEYWNNPLAHSLAKEAYKEGKIVAAICIAPVTLANSGILENKRATVWPGVKEKLIAAGVNYTGAGVEQDGNIITADGPGSAESFGYKILETLKEREK